MRPDCSSTTTSASRAHWNNCSMPIARCNGSAWMAAGVNDGGVEPRRRGPMRVGRGRGKDVAVRRASCMVLLACAEDAQIDDGKEAARAATLRACGSAQALQRSGVDLARRCELGERNAELEGA